MPVACDIAIRLERNSIPEPNSGCRIWIGSVTSGGYGNVGVERSTKRAHRVAWELVHGTVPDNLFVCHKCDNRLCINDDHLFVGTRSDNMQDMIRKGRANYPLGSKATASKLTESEVIEIVKDRRTNETVASAYGVHEDTVRDIRKGRSWAWLTGIGQ